MSKRKTNIEEEKSHLDYCFRYTCANFQVSATLSVVCTAYANFVQNLILFSMTATVQIDTPDERY